MPTEAKVESCPEIKDYVILEKIGQGGLAEIYKARQISLNRPVAIKVLFQKMSNDPDIVKRFDRESKTIARLNHPNIVHVIDKGQSEGRYYFIMELVAGKSFKELIPSHKVSVRKKLEIVSMMLKGLDYAHKCGVIHRDIKPANILVDRQGHAMVADFGIAHIATKSTDIDLTNSDMIMGTMAYMSPEQKMSAASVDQTTDIYATGIILYEILVGRRPDGQFKSPSELNPDIPKKFDEIIKRCLAQDPKDRYQSAEELAGELNEILDASKKKKGDDKKESDSGVESFIGKCQFLDTLKDTRYSKTMLVENTETHELFVIKKNTRNTTGLKEARILTNLKHKNIISILGAGSDHNRLVVAMEYAAGGTLADRMTRPLPFKETMKIAVDIATGLEFAFKNGIVHGNLRPSNVLFCKDGSLKVSDFGLPPHYNLMDKNWYAPPEKRVSSQGDVYGLGVIIYKLMFDKNPAFDRGGNLVIDKGVKGLPIEFEGILRQMLAIRVAKRYRSIEEFLNDWDELQKLLENRKPVKKAVKAPPPKKNNKPIIITISAIGAIVAIIVILHFAGVFK